MSEKNRIYNTHLLQVRSLFILLVFTAVLSYPRLSNAEGTKQTCPFAADTNYLTLLYPIFNHPNQPLFATANSGEAGRLYIHIQNPGETIWFGFAVQSRAKAAAYTYTLFDPSGNIVKSGTVSGTQQGYIKHYLQAVAGPSALATGGYNALSYTTTNTGDYYIEFSPPYNGSLQLKYYDIAVSGPGNTPIIPVIFYKIVARYHTLLFTDNIKYFSTSLILSHTQQGQLMESQASQLILPAMELLPSTLPSGQIVLLIYSLMSTLPLVTILWI